MMETTLQALYQAILDAPEDDAPRLVYADWLDENADTPSECHRCNGSDTRVDSMYGFKTETVLCTHCDGTGRVSNHFAERAEFIRVQCELAELLKDIPDHFHACLDMLFDPEDRDDQRRKYRIWKLQERCHALQTSQQELNWSEGVPRPSVKLPMKHQGNQEELLARGYTGLVFRRGFIDEVRLTLAQFLEHGRQIASEHPVLSFVATDKRPEETPSGYSWFFIGLDNDPATLPLDLLDDLKECDGIAETVPPTEERITFLTKQNADIALQISLVNNARRHLGMPTLRINHVKSKAQFTR